MLEIYDMPQGSEEWENLRRPLLTGSELSKVLSSRKTITAQLVKEPDEEQLTAMAKRAKRQAEVVEILKKGPCDVSELNASGLKGLKEKGFVAVREDNDTCSLLRSSAKKHIDLLIAMGHRTEGQYTYTLPELGQREPTAPMDRGTELEPLARIEFENITGKIVEEVGFCKDPDISPMVGVSPDGLVDNRQGIIEIKCPLPQTHIGYLRKGTLPTEYKAQVHGVMAITGANEAWFISYCPGLPTLILSFKRSRYTESLIQSIKHFSDLYSIQLEELTNANT